jgi:poly-gamma-glutamate synthesis protein (capsule biosynthesis protein)
MASKIDIAVTGDTIINRRLSVHTEERFLSMIKIIRDADVAYTHLETLVHDYDGPEVYPAAEAGWTWMRSPRFVIDELKWAGFNMVSHASNHCLDYAYGGLYSTWQALKEADLVYAGTGMNLGDARAPAYLETTNGRVALISMCSSFANWARAGETRRDVRGRPGLNPLRFHYVADRDTIDGLKELAFKLGWWIVQDADTLLFNPAGVHNTVYKFIEGDEPGISSVVDADDAEGNLRAVSDASRQADYVLVHLHTHEWGTDKGLSAPADFVPPFARACIDAGADVFIGQGSHAQLRGFEIYQNRAIFYDPGDFMAMSNTVTRLPADFYWRAGYDPRVRDWDATTADAFDARLKMPAPLNPPGGYRSAPVLSSVIGVCSFIEGVGLSEVNLYPVTMLHETRSRGGMPVLADPELAEKTIAYLNELSAPFNTRIEFREGIGQIKLQ